MSKRIKVRPGKTQSKFAMIVGIVFCCIGVFIVIPVFGPFGILWTGVAAYITYSHYRNGYTDRPMATYEIDVDDDHSIENRLKNLDSLYNQGLITREEYDSKRKEILEDI
ncbi:MAG: SHOCT domain-containing protein [Bacilli bacterium]|nr:SHOCT domain-containing protein [Bacilli bacterium]